MAKRRVLFIGDGVTPTGFSTVTHNIIKNLDKEEFEVHHLAVNYLGDPHGLDWYIYPAGIRGDVHGLNRIPEFFTNKWDGVFILNDVWMVHKYLYAIKQATKEIPPVVVYFPVDSYGFATDWFEHFDIVKKVVVYTEFAKDVVQTAVPGMEVEVIPHGVDLETFYKVPDAKQKIYNLTPDYQDSFIVLSSHRNQPRKRYDLTLHGFSIFAKDKPENVKLYCHCGIKDVGFDIIRLSKRYGIEERLIMTNDEINVQIVPVQLLNLIYNATDVGITTSLGEGWGLTNHEHAAVGKPQVVPDHSACRELYSDVGLLIPIGQEITNNDTLTISGLVDPQGVADKLNLLYNDKKLYDELAEKSYNKFTSEDYNWKAITKTQWVPLFDKVW